MTRTTRMLSNSKDNSPNYQTELHAHANQHDTSCTPRQHLSCHLLVAEHKAAES